MEKRSKKGRNERKGVESKDWKENERERRSKNGRKEKGGGY